MNSSNLFVLGLLLLTANLSLGALFSPSRAGRAEADRLLILWKILFLAAVQIGAWAIVLDQGGAAPSLALAFTRAAACFALIGGSGGGLAAPWGEVAPFIALNGLLYVLLSIVSLIRGHKTFLEQDGDAGLLQNPAASKEVHSDASPGPALAHTLVSTAVPAHHEERVVSSPLPKQAPPVFASNGGAPTENGEKSMGATGPGEVGRSKGDAPSKAHPKEPDFKPGGFRATIPKAAPLNPQLSPEEELAEQMKPVGPTPPPIRFQWKSPQD